MTTLNEYNQSYSCYARYVEGMTCRGSSAKHTYAECMSFALASQVNTAASTIEGYTK